MTGMLHDLRPCKAIVRKIHALEERNRKLQEIYASALMRYLLRLMNLLLIVILIPNLVIAGDRDFEANLQPFLRKYCIRCCPTLG